MIEMALECSCFHGGLYFLFRKHPFSFTYCFTTSQWFKLLGLPLSVPLRVPLSPFLSWRKGGATYLQRKSLSCMCVFASILILFLTDIYPFLFPYQLGNLFIFIALLFSSSYYVLVMDKDHMLFLLDMCLFLLEGQIYKEKQRERSSISCLTPQMASVARDELSWSQELLLAPIQDTSTTRWRISRLSRAVNQDYVLFNWRMVNFVMTCLEEYIHAQYFSILESTY